MRLALGTLVALIAIRSIARADDAAVVAPPVPTPAPTPTPPTAPPPPFQTIVTGPEPAPAAAREDRAAAVSVVLPSESPRAYDNLGTLLLEVPGVTVARTGSQQAFSSITLRGSNPDQVSIYVDGVPLNVAQGGGVDISTLPVGDIERVEVYRGTTPLVFGETALGGVISITTRTPSTTRASLRAGVGSFGTQFADATGGGRVGRVRLYLGMHVFSSKGDYPYRDDNNTTINLADDYDALRQNNDALEGNGVFRASVTLKGRRTLGLGVLGFARAQGLPGPTNFKALYARFHTMRGLGYLRYESRDDLGPGGRLSADAFFGAERDRLLDPYAEIEQRGAVAVHQTTLSTGITVHATRPLGEWARAALVLEGRRETYTPANELDPTDSGVPARRLVGVAGAELDLYWHRLDLHVIPSARIEAMNDLVTGQNGAGMFLPEGPAIKRWLPTYRVALVRPLDPVASLKGNVGRYQHAPSFLELYGDGTGRLLGNPSLVPEKGTNADLALWIDRPGRVEITSRTTVFGALASDLIYWPRTSDGPSRAQNLTSARVYGVEQELRLGLGRHVRLIAQATYTVADDQSASPSMHGKQIPHHPREAAYARPELLRVPLPGGLDFAAYTDAALLAGAYDDSTNLVHIPAQVLVGAGASLLWPRAHLRVTASALNLTDLQNWNFSYWPLPGRTAFVALAYDSTMDPSTMGGSDSQLFNNL